MYAFHIGSVVSWGCSYLGFKQCFTCFWSMTSITWKWHFSSFLNFATQQFLVCSVMLLSQNLHTSMLPVWVQVLQYQLHYQDTKVYATHFCNMTNSITCQPRQSCVTLYPDVWTLCLLYNCCCHCCVSCQYLRPVRVARPWHSRTVLPRRTPLLRRCTLTSWWDQCRRRTQRMKSKGSLTCSWRKRRLAPCHHPPVAQTAPMKWDLTTLMAPYTI